MSKAILLMDMPVSCYYCDCCHTKPYDKRYRIDGEKFCGITNKDVEVYYYYGVGRPGFCPLREIPEKLSDADLYDEYDNGYEDGWNNFRRKILEG